MSPISAPEPCPNIVRKGDFIFCGDYENRPEECINHRHPFRHCPIGVEKSGCENTTQIMMRIDEGWRIKP
jgi:hypothetical protein